LLASLALLASLVSLLIFFQKEDEKEDKEKEHLFSFRAL
jgi:hypothetical protein